MIDKVQKIREEVERLMNELIQEKEKGFGSDTDDVCILELQNVLTYIDSLQEEPVSVWHDKGEEPDEDRQVLINLSGYCYVDFYHKKDKRFYMFGNPKHYLCEVDRWAYIDDILNLSNVQRTTKGWKEPISEDLEEVAHEYANLRISNYETAFYAFKSGAKWQKEQMMAKAVDGEVGYWNLRGLSVNVDLPSTVEEGDKVKVIVIKED